MRDAASRRSQWGLDVEGMVSSITTMIMVVMCQVLNSNMAYRRSRPVGLECLWTPDGLLGCYLEAELGLGHSYEFVIEQNFMILMVKCDAMVS